MHEIKEDINLFVVGREWPTKSGPIDALAIDAEDDIYIVETKLFKNADKRRVVAQVLDYAASMWANTDFAEFVQVLEQKVAAKFNCPAKEKMAAFFDIGEAGAERIYDNLATNLKSGNFKFVVLMDMLHSQLLLISVL